MLKHLNVRTKSMALCFSLLGILVMASTVHGKDGLLSKQELKTLIAGAQTTVDHERLAKHFTAKANQLEADAKDHEELAAQYKAKPTGHEQKHPMSGQTAAHCEYFAQSLRKATAEARKVAADHHLMAKGASK